MERVGIAELKAELSAYLRRVKSGEEVIVTERGLPVARIVPIPRGGGQDRERMIREGRIIPRKEEPTREWWEEFKKNMPWPKTKGDARIVEAVLEERDEGW